MGQDFGADREGLSAFEGGDSERAEKEAELRTAPLFESSEGGEDPSPCDRRL